MSQINFQEDKQYSDFEIVLMDKKYCPVQKRLIPTGKKVSYFSNSGNDLWEFFEKHEEIQKAKAGKKGRNRNNRKQAKK